MRRVEEFEMASNHSVWLGALAMFVAGCGGGGGADTSATPVGGETLFAVTDTAASDPANPLGPAGTHAYWQGSVLFMERREGNEVTRVAVDTARGGFISEASLNGINFVNAHDTGRGVQLSLYDGSHRYDSCAGCSGSWGWNPVQGGDRYNHGSAVLSTVIDAQGITIRTHPLEWMPAESSVPVPSDVIIEQRISPVAGHPRAWRVDFRVESESAIARQVALQELPAVYAGAQYQRLVTYEGPAPWTGDPVTVGIPAPLGQAPIYRHSGERWFALVDDGDQGVALYAPGSYENLSGFIAPGSGGAGGSGAAFARFDSPLAVQPGRVIAGHYYLIVGDHQHARATIYELMASDDGTDVAAPRLVVDRPQTGTAASGVIQVAGWAYDNRILASVSVTVDDMDLGAATLGVTRPDVAAVHPDAPPDSGFGFALDTRQLANGRHRVKVSATDSAGYRSDVVTEIDVAN